MIKPYYEQDGITIYHGDCREILPLLPKVDCFLTDPVYGIEGGRGDGEKRGKGKYEGGHFEDTPQYVNDVCVPVIRLLIDKELRGAVTPGNRCLMLYPQSQDMGCFWHPAAMGRGAWGFINASPILYYGKDPRGGGRFFSDRTHYE